MPLYPYVENLPKVYKVVVLNLLVAHAFDQAARRLVGALVQKCDLRLITEVTPLK
jgi:hypothetical protein